MGGCELNIPAVGKKIYMTAGLSLTQSVPPRQLGRLLRSCCSHTAHVQPVERTKTLDLDGLSNHKAKFPRFPFERGEQGLEYP
jgi:hypothetical protein